MEERDEVRAEKEEGTYNPSSMKYAGDVEFAEIDCAQHRTRCNDFEVGRVPQVSLFRCARHSFSPVAPTVPSTSV